MLEEVWRRSSEATRLDRLIVATDDDRIVAAAGKFGAEVLLTDAAHPSGTDRVAEVATRLGDGHSVVVNIQGDEALLTGSSLDRLVEAFDSGGEVQMATLAESIESVDELFDPNVVKVVTARDVSTDIAGTRGFTPTHAKHFWP